jgi:hypothetical protein
MADPQAKAGGSIAADRAGQRRILGDTGSSCLPQDVSRTAGAALEHLSAARVAAAEGNHTHAHECIAKALATMDRFDLPLADWRVHSTAAALGELSGNREVARRHRDSSRASIARIADSLRLENPLRMTFPRSTSGRRDPCAWKLTWRCAGRDRGLPGPRSDETSTVAGVRRATP